MKSIDYLIQSELDYAGRARWRLLVPPGFDPDFTLNAIAVETTGSGSGHLWEQRDLARAARGSRLLNLGNSGPVLHRDKLVVIHDAAVFRTPDNFSPRYRLFHRLLGAALARTGRICTVSEFSRGELARQFRLSEEDILVAGNGCDHFKAQTSDEKVLEALGVERGRYFLFVGNPSPNKNLALMLEAFARLDRPEAKLVVAGALDRSVFGGRGVADANGVVLASRRSDEEIAALYAHASAFVFPSRYEGFGIPPLEAMANGCPVIASDIPVLREVCGDAAAYFSLDDGDSLVAQMRQHWDQPQRSSAHKAAADKRVSHFRWDNSARVLIEALLGH